MASHLAVRGKKAISMLSGLSKREHLMKAAVSRSKLQLVRADGLEIRTSYLTEGPTLLPAMVVTCIHPDQTPSLCFDVCGSLFC
jgi:hypothetical protein